MQLFTKTLIICGLPAMLLFVACDDCPDLTNPKCDNYDPCHDLLDADADFGIYQILRVPNGTKLFLERDTIAFEVIFKPKYGDHTTKYEWKIGSDPKIWTQKNLIVNFSGFSGTIPVRLIMIQESIYCKSDNHKYRDTIWNSFTYIEPTIYDTPLAGKFRGADMSKPDSLYNIYITYDDYDFITYIDSFPYGCHGNEYNVFQDLNYVYDAFSFNFSGGRCWPYGFGVLSDNNKKLTIDYYTTDNSGMDTIRDVFIGIKQ